MRRFTPEDIRHEHEAAMASLTDAQRCGIGRQRHAHQMTNFNGLSDKQNLELIFEREAQDRNAALDALEALESATAALETAEASAAAEAACANDNQPAPEAPRRAEG